MNKNKQSGITLIALVITIIVLLILAGVTIATISGNNSAPQKGTEASQKDAIAGAKDEIAMETQEALLNYYNNKYVSKTSTSAAEESESQSVVAEAAARAVTNAKSRNKELDASSVSGNKITLKTKSYKVTGTIEENGGITWSDWKVAGEEGVKIKVNGNTVTVTEANAKDYYGTTIASVTVGSVTTNYGLYYIDFAGTYSGGEEGTVYLKALTSVGSFTPNANQITDSDQKTEAVRIMKLLNPDWAANRGTITYDSMQNNEKGAAILCNPNNSLWSGVQTAFENKYGAENVNYVVGGPSSEMLTKAINEAGGLTGTGALDSRWFAAKDNNNTTTTSPYTYSGYLYSKTGKNTDNNTGYGYYTQSSAQQNALTTAQKAMYYSNTNQWLASPASGNYDYFVCYVGSHSSLSRETWGYGRAACPLVSLKSGVSLTVE